MLFAIPIKKTVNLLGNDTENFANGESKKNGVVQALWSILNLILTCIALYLSFARNQGFNFGSALAACCCSPCYILYALAVPVAQPSSFL